MGIMIICLVFLKDLIHFHYLGHIGTALRPANPDPGTMNFIIVVETSLLIIVMHLFFFR